MTNMTDEKWVAIHAGLIATFPADEVGQREGRAGMTYDYIDARAVYDRLDAVVGPDGWATAYRVLNLETCAVECTLTINGISRSDVGYPNTPVGATNAKGKAIDSDEPLKDAYSDAVKRAAVQWGIGRYLYGKAGSKASPNGSRSAAGARDHDEPPPEKARLIAQATEALRVLSGTRQTSGKKLIAEWMAETGVQASGFGVLSDAQLAALRDWARANARAPEEATY